MTDYIRREDALFALRKAERGGSMTALTRLERAYAEIREMPAADVADVVRCKGCKYSTLPSELTQRYGKAGTLTCHNKYSPCNRRNVSENDFCSYGEYQTNMGGVTNE